MKRTLAMIVLSELILPLQKPTLFRADPAFAETHIVSVAFMERILLRWGCVERHKSLNLNRARIEVLDGLIRVWFVSKPTAIRPNEELSAIVVASGPTQITSLMRVAGLPGVAGDGAEMVSLGLVQLH